MSTIEQEKMWIRKFLRRGAKVEIARPDNSITITYKGQTLNLTEYGDDMSHISISYSNGRRK